ncbi:branched-chain amino acid transaminase [Candidatus Pacearchaeota archaeon]|nr:branched-chain amino acid transaminase [Candidatus Pacearchaeota archaeon]MBD3282770.1 branched-chain amino acid transaminase [Candidatus Pacearchaeota archaeon]
MQQTKFIWMDGEFVEWENAKIHILTHSLHYGSGVFEGIRFYESEKGPAVFRLKEHVNRLFHSASVFDMKIKYSKGEIENIILELIRKNNLKSGYIRPLIYFGYGKMGLALKGAPVNIAIAVWPWGAYLGERPIKIKTSSFMRLHPESTIQSAKISGNYMNSILATEEVKKQGYDEALLLDCKGKIAEGPGENIFIVKNNKLITPSVGNILPGITRDSIIKIAFDSGINVEEKEISKEEMLVADEAFFTGTAAEITAIESVDDVFLKKSFGPVTKKLRDIYLNVVQGKNSRYEDWLKVV